MAKIELPESWAGLAEPLHALMVEVEREAHADALGTALCRHSESFDWPILPLMQVDLEALVSLAPGQTGVLDRFVSTCLAEADIWEDSRSDGITGIARVLERSPDRVRICGGISELRSARVEIVHTFWLELQREASGDRITWFLYFGVAESSPRRARNAVHDHDRPEDIHWHATLAGEAVVQDSALLPISSSIRMIVRDMPDLEMPP